MLKNTVLLSLILIFGIIIFGCTATNNYNDTATNNYNDTATNNYNDTASYNQNNYSEDQTNYTYSVEIYFYAPETLYPDAVVGQPYKYSFCNPEPTNVNDLCGALEDATNPFGGHYPYHFTLASGVGFQPLGLILNLNGLLTGTPTVAGTKTFGVCAVDLDGRQACNNVTLTVDPIYKLTINKVGEGSGSINVSTGFGESAQKFTCSSDCVLNFTEGITVFLDSAVDNGSVMTEWTGDCTGGFCYLDMDGDKQITANFEKYSASITSATCNYDTSTGYEYRIRISGTATGPENTRVSFDIGDAGGFLGYEDNCGSWESEIFACKNPGSYGSTSWSWTYTRAQPNSNNWGSDVPFDYPVSVGVNVGSNAHQDLPLVIHCS